MIDQLKIENFRGFRSLHLQGLKRVNLIVGSNNSGKTSLLEAVASVTSPSTVENLPAMFRLTTKPKQQEQFFRWLIADGASECKISALGGHADSVQSWSKKPLPRVRYTGHTTLHQLNVGWSHQRDTERHVIPISVQHRQPEDMVAGFAAAARSKERKNVLENLLAKVDPRIKAAQLDYASEETFISVDVGLSEFIPLPQAGQGVYRLVGIFSELLGQRPDLCLIDEIENGLHHSVMKQVWAGLAEAAETLDIQIFATTHSHECLEAAAAAFAERSTFELSVIQLYRVDKGVQGRVLGREEIETGIEADIELR